MDLHMHKTGQLRTTANNRSPDLYISFYNYCKLLTLVLNETACYCKKHQIASVKIQCCKKQQILSNLPARNAGLVLSMPYL